METSIMGYIGFGVRIPGLGFGDQGLVFRVWDVGSGV